VFDVPFEMAIVFTMGVRFLGMILLSLMTLEARILQSCHAIA